MKNEVLDITVLKTFPELDPVMVDSLLAEEIENSSRKIIVLDDDPTGVQTVHDISVYTDWSEESIRAGFLEENKLFFILTNSRGFTAEETEKAHIVISENIAKVSQELGMEYIVISRSDSTLRGHYPLETEILRKVLSEKTGQVFDGEIIFPFFQEGGRYTLNNVHYVKTGDQLIPAGETEFAKDKTFGYRSSDIREYVEEKTAGKYKASDVTCISLEDLRSMNIEGIVKQLTEVKDFNKIIVNSIDYLDVKVFCIALYKALAQGKHYIFRTAAALVKCLGGVSDRPLLSAEEMITSETSNGGIIVVGSHTNKTTEQLKQLLQVDNTVGIEFQSDLVLEGDEALQKEVDRVVSICEELISEGKVPVCYTNRKLLTIENDTKDAALIRSVKISDAVKSLVGDLKIRPAFVIAKGGITSSDIGIKALKVKKATVMGQIKPGIPVWKTGRESRFEGIPYVIFPGNVGEISTLKEAAEILMKKAKEA